jgi:ArsR family transcriptional regulator
MKKKCCSNQFSLDGITSLFKALGDTNRMTIFDHLCNHSQDGTAALKVNEISSCCDVDLSVVSRHLSTLKKAGVLEASKKGKEVFYRLNGTELAKVLRALADYIDDCSQCCTNQGEKHD